MTILEADGSIKASLYGTADLQSFYEAAYDCGRKYKIGEDEYCKRNKKECALENCTSKKILAEVKINSHEEVIQILEKGQDSIINQIKIELSALELKLKGKEQDKVKIRTAKIDYSAPEVKNFLKIKGDPRANQK
jgi:hypothetical protein